MSYYDDEVDFSVLVGQKIVSVDVSEDEIVFTCRSGKIYKMMHFQDCCEAVYVEDICGDIVDILDAPVVVAEVVTSRENPQDAKPETIEYQNSFTWTFYKIDTQKGGITIRWYGDSNGYYSEEVSFVEVKQ